MGTKSAWTPERRARQTDNIRRTKPWEKSTGPRTEAGKAASSRNAYAGDALHELRAKIAEDKSFMLALFDRQRMPKYPRW